MPATVLCDQHVDRGLGNAKIVRSLDFVYVGEHLSPDATDDEIFEAAIRDEMLILTNDSDFLRMEKNDQTGILYYPHQRLRARDLHGIIAEVVRYVSDVNELYGRTTYLTRDWLS